MSHFYCSASCLICYIFAIVVRSFEYRFQILIFTKPSYRGPEDRGKGCRTVEWILGHYMSEEGGYTNIKKKKKKGVIRRTLREESEQCIFLCIIGFVGQSCT